MSTGLPVDWRQRLTRGLLRQPDHDFERCRFGAPWVDPLDGEIQAVRDRMQGRLSPAAVLIPIIVPEADDGSAGGAPSILLTLRASALRAHAGQISFPGGRLEAGDTDAAATALREVEEEVGLARGFVSVLGYLTDHAVITGYRVTPVVGLVRPGFTLTLDPTEVAEVFQVPLRTVMELNNYRAADRGGRMLWELPVGQHVIWGATVGMLLHLRSVFVGGEL